MEAAGSAHSTSGARSATLRRVGVVVLCLFPACVAQQPPAPAVQGEVVFSGTLQELVPHHDGDVFVRKVTGGDLGSGITVERLASRSGGEFVSTLTKDGAFVVSSVWRDEGATASLVSENLGRDLRVVYDPPLRYWTVPLRAGVRRTVSDVTIERQVDGSTAGIGRAEQTMTVERTSGDTSEITVRTERKLSLARGPIVVRGTSVIRPGLGELRTDTEGSSGEIVHMELVCATVAGKQIGDCPEQMP